MTRVIQSTDRITKQDTFGSVHSQTRLVQSSHRITRSGSTRLVQSIHRITRLGSTSLLGSVHSQQDHQIRQYTPGWFSPLTFAWFSPFKLAWFSPFTLAWLGPLTGPAGKTRFLWHWTQSSALQLNQCRAPTVQGQIL